MCSRGVFQLRKLTVFFCDYGGSSSGVRELLGSETLQSYLKANPQIGFQVICKRNYHPHVKGAYINGYTKDVPLRNLTEGEVISKLESLKNQLGRKAFKVNGSRVFGAKQSIQGKWQSNLFNKYPIAELSKTYEIPEIKQQYYQEQDPKRDVRDEDTANKLMKVRPFISYHRDTY